MALRCNRWFSLAMAAGLVAAMLLATGLHLAVPAPLAAACTIPSFAAAVLPAGGAGAYAPVLADFNGDGRLDLATSLYTDGRLALRLNDGIALGPVTTWDAGVAKPTWLVALDADADGRQDLAVLDNFSGAVALHRGLGDGRFLLLETAAGTPYSSGLASADLRGDGHHQLLVAIAKDRAVSILEWSAAGILTTTLTVDSSHVGAALAADVTGDGYADLLVVDRAGGRLLLLPSTGAGSFGTARAYATSGPMPTRLATGDFDHDGWHDVAVIDQLDATITVLLNDGAGGLRLAASLGAGGNEPADIVAADVTADGHLDLVVDSRQSGAMLALLGYGDGTFSSATTIGTSGPHPNGLASGDLNGDARLDLAVANQGDGTNSTVVQFLNTCSEFGTPVAATATPAPVVATVPPEPTPTPGPAPTYTAYFAEGYTGAGFETYLTLANTTGLPSAVAVTFQYGPTGAGPPGTVAYLKPWQRLTLSVNVLVGPDREVSIGLSSTRPFAAERPVYFRGYRLTTNPAVTIDGGHLGQPASAPTKTWYFAEGFTDGDFDNYVTIQNPGLQASEITLLYLLADGQILERLVLAPAGSRITVPVHGPDVTGGIGRGRTYSLRLAARQPVVAERITYFRYGLATGGSAVLGATAESTTWHFAEGYTGAGFDEYLTIMNASSSPGLATVLYFVAGSSTPEVRSIALPATSRTTVAVYAPPEQGGIGRGLGHATTVETTVPTVVERPTYFLYTGSAGLIDGGHTALGATATWPTGAVVVMAEGYTGADFDQYLAFQNPNSADAWVTVSYLLDSGTVVGPKTVRLPARQRLTVRVHDSADASGAGLGRDYAFATRIDVLDGGAAGVIAERVLYFRYSGDATGGTSAFGVRVN